MEATTTQVHRLAANPLFHDLRRLLITECTSTQLPVTLMDSSVTEAPPSVAVRDTALRLKFIMLAPHLKPRAVEMEQFYKTHFTLLTNDRTLKLHSATTPAEVAALNSHYDTSIHQLITRVHASMTLLETVPCDDADVPTSAQPSDDEPQSVPKSPSPLSPPSRHSPRKVKSKKGIRAPGFKAKFVTFNPRTVKVLSAWYDRNTDFPYPNDDTVDYLASKCEISAEQVRKWFSNKRMRTRNTLPLKEIARRRAQTVCYQEDWGHMTTER